MAIRLLLGSGLGLPLTLVVVAVGAVLLVWIKRGAKAADPTPTEVDGPTAPKAPPIVVNEGPPSAPTWQPGDP